MINKVSKTISFITFPFIVAVPTIFLLLLSETDLSKSVFWTLLSILFIAIFPLIYILLKIRTKRISNLSIDIRNQRKSVFICYSLSIIFGIICFYAINAPVNLIIGFWGLLTIVLISFMINSYVFKISVHMLGMGLSFSLLFQYYTTLSIAILILSVFTALARFYLKKHTVTEIISGFVLGITVGFALTVYSG